MSPIFVGPVYYIRIIIILIIIKSTSARDHHKRFQKRDWTVSQRCFEVECGVDGDASTVVIFDMAVRSK